MPRRWIVSPSWLVAIALLGTLPGPALAQETGWANDPPDLQSIIELARHESELRLGLVRYRADQAAIERRYPVSYSPVRRARLRGFYDGWQERLRQLDFAALSREGQIDYVLLRQRITFDQAMLRLDETRWDQMASLVPFADPLRTLQETRHDRRRVDPRETAGTMDSVAAATERLTRELSERGGRGTAPVTRTVVTPAVAARAADHVDHLRSVVADFNAFYAGYDPLYTWWVAEAFTRLGGALEAYASAIRTHLVGLRPGEPEPIIGDPVLAEGLRAHLAVEMIPYSAEELIEIGGRELAWTERELRRVAADMGYADDWKAALEYVKRSSRSRHTRRPSSSGWTPSPWLPLPRKCGVSRCKRPSGSSSTRSSAVVR